MKSEKEMNEELKQQRIEMIQQHSKDLSQSEAIYIMDEIFKLYELRKIKFI